MPELTRPQFPEVEIDEALMKRPALPDIWSRLLPSRGDAKLCGKLKFGDEATEPPNFPFQSPKLQREWRSAPDAELKRAAEDDVAC